MKRQRSLCLASIIIVAGLFSSCTHLKVESNPPGATILWSRDGLEPYRPWPPNGWETASSKRGSQTPFSTSGLFSDTMFVTVEKEGYRRPLPQPVQLYSFHREKVEFVLPEMPETTAARMRAQGKLYYKGDWVDPEVAGVVEFNGVVMPKEEAFEKEQSAKGLMLYNGVWYEKAAADAAMRADMEAKGLTFYKDRWIKASEKTKEEAIDKEVAAIRETKTYPDLPAPKVIGSASATDSAQVQVYNSTGQKVRFLFSGPQSLAIELNPYQSTGVKIQERIIIPPGRYDIVVVPTGMDASGRDLAQLLGGSNASGLALSTKPVWSSWPLVKKTQYSFNFTGLEGDLQDSMSDFNAPAPNIKIDVPTIEIPDIKLPEQEPSQYPRSGGNSGGGGSRGGRGSR